MTLKLNYIARFESFLLYYIILCSLGKIDIFHARYKDISLFLVIDISINISYSFRVSDGFPVEYGFI
jgi:hypothetical protein